MACAVRTPVRSAVDQRVTLKGANTAGPVRPAVLLGTACIL
jgi:hypothetical protein